MHDDTIEKHPSFAQISASRVNSNPAQPMYGSKLKHGRYIVVTISESECHRSINSDRFHDRAQLIRVRMTENQFAQFITSLNIGGGTPCTLERHNGKAIDSPPYKNELAVVKGEFEAKAEEVAKTLADAQKRLAAMLAPGGKTTKAELHALQSEIEKAAREIGANMPYMAECFEETMEDVVTAAKTDIEAYMSDAAARAGLSAGAVPPVVMLEAGDETWDERQARHMMNRD